jgi:hypothetical protein
VPIDVAVEEPWSRVVSEEPNGDVVGQACANAHDITNDGVVEVIGCVPSTANDMEGVLLGNLLANRNKTATYSHLRRGDV